MYFREVLYSTIVIVHYVRNRTPSTSTSLILSAICATFPYVGQNHADLTSGVG